MTAFLGVLALLVPVMQNTHALGIFGLDVKNAKAFSQEFSYSVKQMSLLGEGTSFTIKINPLNKWTISTDNDVLTITIESKQLNKSKQITTILTRETDEFKLETEKETNITLYKEDNKISVINS